MPYKVTSALLLCIFCSSALSQPVGLIERAEVGDSAAQYELAKFYATDPEKQDLSKSFSLIEAAAKALNPDALFQMGVLFSQGQLVPQNEKKASDLYLLAAEQGHSDAQINLGILYALGNGVEMSRHEAYFWFLLASVKDPKARNLRDSLAKDIPTDVRNEIQQRASEWSPMDLKKR